MGWNYRKSVKIGGVRINFSKSGIGVSSGIKGLRIGVNSKGRTYVSAGRNGMYYKKTYGSKSRSDYRKVDEHTNAISFIITFIIFFIIIGCFFPKIFIIPAVIAIYGILWAITTAIKLKTINKYIKEIYNAITDHNYESLENIFPLINKKYNNQKDLFDIYERTYSHLVEKVLDDAKISEEERKVISVYEKYVPQNYFTEINSQTVDGIVENIIEDGIVTETEEKYLNEVLDVFFVGEEKKEEINCIINQTKEIDNIKKNGLKKINIENEITKGKNCFYFGDIELIKSHTVKGIQSYEKDLDGKIYITENSLEFVAEGHKVVKIENIFSVETKDGYIQITIKNRQRPIYIFSNEPLLIITIIGELKNKS